ncbi:non-heme iron oxygenase ferredoxin subunit [Mycolicibacterium sp. CH28]|uniref:non-heme iron oxygenase ferredoxin subunit n=1 Tax=Mycolicibacterium sp. CH28 TaxID=2512237 RepID=UPI00108190AD|nr:non-heme iron oxygenase ferredoxin subunit [Mycolicibacterium sp. CH28]TGD85198.1 non-heme iron oxygenase ferredoxin subunit [Mycolicibacterium sp. CH28]
MDRRFACRVDDLPKGSSMTIPGEEPIALYRTDNGDFYATSDSCTHEQWSLGSDSELEGTEVMCPLHMARFCVITGKALCFPATRSLSTYVVEIEDDSVYVLV